MAIPIGDKDVAVAIHRNAIEAGELGRGAAQRLDRGVVARGRDLLDGAMARVADKNIVIGVDGDGVRLAEATASYTALLPASATKRFPAPSTAMP
jgi:hypothetical protein